MTASNRPSGRSAGAGVARRATWLVVLTTTWVLLHGEASPANVVGGLLVAAGVLVLAPVAPVPGRHRVHPIAAGRFALFLLWNLLTSSWAVVVTSLRPTDERLRAGIVRVELPGATPLVTTLVANAITLTPGTLTVAADNGDGTTPVLHVHVLGLDDLDGFRADIAELHARAAAAFTPHLTPAGEAP